MAQAYVVRLGLLTSAKVVETQAVSLHARPETAPRHRLISMRIRLGFTLVELLLVIAIIGLGSGILFPVLRSAKTSAKESDHISQLHQIGVSWELYSQDTGDTIPTVQKLLQAKHLPSEVFTSKCDPYPNGWTNIGGDTARDPYFDSKISIVDVAITLRPYHNDSATLRHNLDDSKVTGWAIIPGCAAKLEFRDERSPSWSNAIIGTYKRLRFDTSVQHRTMTLTPNSQGTRGICIAQYFSDLPCRLQNSYP